MKKRRNPGTPKFVPTDEQRRLVAILSGFCVNQDEICKLIPGCNGNKRISKITLHRHFKAELETGNIALKELIARKFVDALEESWAIRLGLKNKMKWSITDHGALPPETLEGDGTPEIQITFVTPSAKQAPIVDAEPSAYPSDAKPDSDRPALEPPRPRQRTDFGIIEQPRSYETQMPRAEQPPSIWDRGSKNGWMK
jgi:hypothetical protein